MDKNIPSFWHTRFLQQAQWTKELRTHLYARARIASARRVLDLGCGTGVLLTELLMHTHGIPYGLDISPGNLQFTAHNLPGLPITLGDGHNLPYRNASFDIALCHFVLLWVTNPVQVVKEMARVTLPGGIILALAEPDYGGRIDYPPEVAILGKWQQIALGEQGADPLLGRKLRSIFHQAGLSEVEAGLLGGQWSGTPSPDELALEWQVMKEDFSQSKNKAGIQDIDTFRDIDQAAWKQESRILFVPTFYAFGRVADQR